MDIVIYIVIAVVALAAGAGIALDIKGKSARLIATELCVLG